MPRNHTVFTPVAAMKAGNYDERPMLPDTLDLQIHLSKNDRPQPFHLICEHDTVLMAMSGTGHVEYKDSSVNRHSYEMGDHLYVPAGVPHRIVPTSESILYRYKLPESELEGVAFYCEKCGGELKREVFEIKAELPQEGYARITKAFNANAENRACKSCGAVHPEIDISAFRWTEVAKELKEEAKEPAKTP
jgi:3-hydroxyanthranilate 3,4-dioxygenase